MARMAMMGRRSVDYHRKTLRVGAPSNDLDAGLEPGVEVETSAALRYYSSHGETPLVWGGSGAERLGLSGAVSAAQYEALYSRLGHPGGRRAPGPRPGAIAHPGDDLGAHPPCHLPGRGPLPS